MRVAEQLRHLVKQARKRGAAWPRILDKARLLALADGRAVLLTSVIHFSRLHQTTTYTAAERYPELFDYALEVAPGARRVLSFGCATGEELTSFRSRFPQAEIVGVEINHRCRRIARQRLAHDAHARVVAKLRESDRFDLVAALAVLQREPHDVLESGMDNLRRRYPFDRFDAAARQLVAALNPGGTLLVYNSHYRVEDSSSAAQLEPLADSPKAYGPFFRPDGSRYDDAKAFTAFRKIATEG